MGNNPIADRRADGAAPGGPPPAVRWLILLMAAASAACAMMSAISFSTIIGSLARDLRIDLGSASFAFVGVPSFAMALGMAVLGFVVDRLGVFRVVIGSLVTLILSNTALLVCGDSFTSILIIRVVQGLCSAGLMVTITPAIARWFPRDEIGRAMGLPSLGAGIGMVIGLNVVPLSMGYLGSWQRGASTLAIVAAGALVIAVSAARLSRGREVTGVSSDVEGLSRPALVWRLPLFWIGLAVISLACWANMSFSDLTPGFLSVAPPVGAGYGPRNAGGLMSLFAISSIVGAPLAGVLTDTVFRDRNRSVLLIGFAISTAAYPAVLSSAVHGHRGVLAGTLLAAGLANPFVNVTLMGIAAKQVDAGTVGRICGLWMSVSFFAGAAGVLVGSLALRVSGDFRISLAIAGLASIVGFCASLLHCQEML